jgi:sugar phosphate isomerase/epimerase
MEHAAEFFATLAPAYHACGSCLSFEANPPKYGCRFATCTAEAAELVRRVHHPGFGLQIDTGTVLMNGESPDSLGDLLPLVAHVHVSEPNLAVPVPVPSRAVAHQPIAAALRRAGYAGWLSAEMRMVPDWRAALAAAAALLGELYP